MAKVAKKAAPKAKAKTSKVKAVKKPVSKAAPKKTPVVKAKSTGVKAKSTGVKAKPAGSKRLVSDAKIAKLQKMYKSSKHSAQQLCDEFGISMATLFNYLKVKI